MAESALQTALKDELASLERVIVLLKEEQDILTRARIDQLAKITEEKNRAIAELEQFSTNRQTVMSSHDIPDDGSAISAWITQHDPAALELWETLIDLAKQAAQYNRSNGKLLASREEANRTLMNILIADHDADTSYTANGRLSHNSATRRRFDKA